MCTLISERRSQWLCHDRNTVVFGICYYYYFLVEMVAHHYYALLLLLLFSAARFYDKRGHCRLTLSCHRKSTRSGIKNLKKIISTSLPLNS